MMPRGSLSSFSLVHVLLHLMRTLGTIRAVLLDVMILMKAGTWLIIRTNAMISKSIMKLTTRTRTAR